MNRLPRITALIAEDEAPASARLRELLSGVSWIDVVGECADGPSAIATVDSLEPDLLFLDLQMPGCDGLEVLRSIHHTPAVVFTTAHDRYAVTAFEVGAIDYLLKPFGRERLQAALDRVRRSLGRGPDSSLLERVGEALDSLQRLTRLFIRTRTGIIVVPVTEIRRFETRGDYSALFVEGQRYLIHLPLGELEERLDPKLFVRVHRSHIINLDFVQTMVPLPDSRLEVRLRDGTRITASRARSQWLRELSL